VFFPITGKVQTRQASWALVVPRAPVSVRFPDDRSLPHAWGSSFSQGETVKKMLGSVYDASRVAELSGITYSPEEIAGFGLPPPTLDGFVTFFDSGWPLLRLRNAVATKGKIFYPQRWYDTQEFAEVKEKPRYRQIRMAAVKDSFNKTFADQQTLLPPDEEVPLARQVIMGTVLHFLATGERLFVASYVRCRDKGSDSIRVGIGFFDGAGLFVGSVWDGSPDSYVGLASARKS
jgi:hypothetical protein